ncbi:MAG: sigma-70 family RNA polymerase sigma factor [Dokdonella sp.]
MARARRGDMQAFEAIYRLYGRACYNLALRILGQPAAAEDMVQDVFVRLIERIGSYRGDAPFGAWLKRMASNAIIDALRHRSYREVGNEDIVAAAVETGAAPEATIDAWTLLQRLPPRSRAIVVLSHWEGFTHLELGERFGRSESWSKSILARAMHQLKAGGTNRNNEGDNE